MTKQNQIVAVEKSVKAASYKKFTETHKRTMKPALLSGIARSYRPKDEDGDHYPAESTKVQVRIEDSLQEVAKALTKTFDIILTKDTGNCIATADVVVDAEVILENVPVTYLLFLEKQLNDLSTFIEKLPILDPSESWQYSDANACWATTPVDTTKTKNVLKNHEKSPATKEHPAQVTTFQDTVLIGYWTTTKFSGALPATRKSELEDRLQKLQQAVKKAREKANGTEIEHQKAGEAFFGYLFGR